MSLIVQTNCHDDEDKRNQTQTESIICGTRIRYDWNIPKITSHKNDIDTFIHYRHDKTPTYI